MQIVIDKNRQGGAKIPLDGSFYEILEGSHKPIKQIKT